MLLVTLLNNLIKVREKALKLAKNWNIINTCQSINEVQNQIETILDNLDNGKNNSESKYINQTAN